MSEAISHPKFGTLSSEIFHHTNCFGCGSENQIGLHADFKFDEPTGEVRFTYTIKKEFEGAPGYSHGGILASLLDEAQGDLCFHLGHFVMTDQLYMKYNKAVSLEKEIHIRAWITAVRKRRLYTKGTIHSKDGELLVSSKARWYDLPERIMLKMFPGDYPISEIMGLMEENRKRAKKIRHAIKEK